MFTREYAWLILIGFLISAPLAGFAMQQFLNEFSYKIPLGFGIFVLSLGLTILIAVVTVGYKSISAAIVNPVKSLRYE
jgi:mannitol-specific phosphotransferase system IIBC component